MGSWAGDNPYYLLLSLDYDEPALSREQVVVDLDKRGWLTELKSQLDTPGEWHLVRKEGDVVTLSMRVWPGDQPYYTARVIGTVGYGEIRAYSIGKKTRRKRKGAWHDNEDNLWVLPWGQICGGTDVEYFATSGMKKGLR